MYDIYINGKYIGKGTMFYNFVATEKHNWNESRGEIDVLFVGGPIAGKSMKLRTPLESIMEIPYPCKRGEEGKLHPLSPVASDFQENIIGYMLLSYRRVNCLRVGSVHYEWEHTIAMDKLPEKYQRLIVRTN